MKARISNPSPDVLIRICYEEFKAFIHNDQLPDFDIAYTPDATESIASYQCKDGRHIITIDERFPNAQKSDYIGILFHEFTHLSDQLSPVIKCFSLDESMYFDEYHATKVASLYSLGCKDLQLTSNIQYTQKVTNYLTFCHTQFQKFFTDAFPKSFNKIPDLRLLDYKCACLSGVMSANNLLFPCHTNEILSFDVVPQPYQKYIVEIFNILENHDLSHDVITQTNKLLADAKNDLSIFFYRQFMDSTSN